MGKYFKHKEKNCSWAFLEIKTLANIKNRQFVKKNASEKKALYYSIAGRSCILGNTTTFFKWLGKAEKGIKMLIKGACWWCTWRGYFLSKCAIANPAFSFNGFPLLFKMVFHLYFFWISPKIYESSKRILLAHIVHFAYLWCKTPASLSSICEM